MPEPHASALTTLPSSFRLSVAPMMGQTTYHCRGFHRALSPHAVLYTEMMSTGALLHGPRDKLLRHDTAHGPVSAQLGGNNPQDLARAARLVEQAGFDEVNLNVGCPSPRVKRGAFGACLMLNPEVVAEGMAAVRDAVALPVTVKCRLGVDEHDEPAFLHRFVETVAEAGVSFFTVHARKALLNGLSPAQNRQIPPLHYDRVHALVSRYPQLRFELNGGLASVEAVQAHVGRVHGAMLGRAVYGHPWLLAELETALYGTALPPGPRAVLEGLLPAIAEELARGTRLHEITRHMLGLFAGFPGARRFRQVLSTRATREGGSMAPLLDALSMLKAA